MNFFLTVSHAGALGFPHECNYTAPYTTRLPRHKNTYKVQTITTLCVHTQVYRKDYATEKKTNKQEYKQREQPPREQVIHQENNYKQTKHGD
jgi:hypothetical protein